MNYPATIASPIADVQNEFDHRNIPIDRAGVRNLRHPATIMDRSGCRQHTVASCSMYVSLSGSHKGAHMSRFVEIVNRRTLEITVENFSTMVPEMVELLDAESGFMEMTFTYFMKKAAPVTGASSYLDYTVSLISGMIDGNPPDTQIKVAVPVTTLCPCAKKISDYGAHNQRSLITLHACIRKNVWIEELIEIAEKSASCELYGLLKRSDEKYVTEHAYDNPKFVEDIVRDIAVKLGRDDRISGYTIESENFESIHNHSAYAKIHHHDCPAWHSCDRLHAAGN